MSVRRSTESIRWNVDDDDADRCDLKKSSRTQKTEITIIFIVIDRAVNKWETEIVTNRIALYCPF